LLAGGCALRAVPRPPSGSESAERIVPGPYRVSTRNVVLEDRARGRTLASTVWWPASRDTPAPLVVQTHGFLANRTGGAYVARHLASRGYVVIAATHPTTTLFAHGGPKVEDVVKQPGDVRFLIDRVLGADTGITALPPIDRTHIAVMGHSLGGLTATLAAFHPRLRDPRIAAAISIAGPLAMFQPAFFRTADVPFLMIAGTGDVVIDYRRNAYVTLERVPRSTLVLIGGGSHAGFDNTTRWLPRFVDNPDVFSCWILRRTVHLDAAIAKMRTLTRPDEGIDLEHGVRVPCTEKPPHTAMAPARQQLITVLAATAFLESRFAPDAAERRQAREYLTTTLGHELPDVAVSTTAGADAP
jgi:predicted dienelactone hydrolase